MFTRILVPLDGSKRAERALLVAARLVRASHGTLIVVQVLDRDPYLYSAPGMMLSESVLQAASDDAARYLAEVTAPFVQEGIPVEPTILLGIPASLILSTITSYNADLVVLCSHGRTGLLHWALGSVAEKLARLSPAPVLILREHGSLPAGPHPDPTRPLRVLVPLDGSTVSKQAIEPAATLIAALAAPASGAMHLLRVVRPPQEVAARYHQQSLDDLIQQTKHSLQRTVHNIRDGFEAPAAAPLDLALSSSVAVDTDIAQAIVRVAENGEDVEGVGVFGGCDVIAMVTHGRIGLDHLALGSITERVLRTSRIPLLVVPMRWTTEQAASEPAHEAQHPAVLHP